MTEEEMKRWINSASYVDLLRKWRFEPAGSPWFRGIVGEHFSRVIKQKRDADPDGAVTASKQVGWG